MKRILVACLLLSGCAAKHAPKVVIPLNCLKIQVTDFSKPCEEIDSSHVRCDGVIVHIFCTATKKQ